MFTNFVVMALAVIVGCILFSVLRETVRFALDRYYYCKREKMNRIPFARNPYNPISYEYHKSYEVYSLECRMNRLEERMNSVEDLVDGHGDEIGGLWNKIDELCGPHEASSLDDIEERQENH